MKEISHFSVYRENVEDESVQFPGFSIPKNLVPPTVIRLFSELALQMDENAFQDLLARTQETICKKGSQSPATQQEWLLLLILLKTNPNERVKEQVEQFISRDDFPHTTLKDVLLEHQPGTVYVQDNGNIRIATHPISKAHPLYTSPYVPPAEEVRVQIFQPLTQPTTVYDPPQIPVTKQPKRNSQHQLHSSSTCYPYAHCQPK